MGGYKQDSVRKRNGTPGISHGFGSLSLTNDAFTRDTLEEGVVWLHLGQMRTRFVRSLLSDLCIPVGNQYTTKLTADRFVIRARNANTLRNERHKSIVGRSTCLSAGVITVLSGTIARLNRSNRSNRFVQEIVMFWGIMQGRAAVRGALQNTTRPKVFTA